MLKAHAREPFRTGSQSHITNLPPECLERSTPTTSLRTATRLSHIPQNHSRTSRDKTKQKQQTGLRCIVGRAKANASTYRFTQSSELSSVHLPTMIPRCKDFSPIGVSSGTIRYAQKRVHRRMNLYRLGMGGQEVLYVTPGRTCCPSGHGDHWKRRGRKSKMQ